MFTRRTLVASATMMNEASFSKQRNVAEEQLESAFQLFNQYSEKLTDSYGFLESHVTRLTKELSDEREERLLQLSENQLLAKRLECLLNAIPAGIVVLDNDGLVIQTNPVAREMLALATDSHKAWEEIANESFISVADELKLKNGRWVNVSSCGLGEYPGKIILISDVTETHNLQTILNRQQRLSALGEMIASLAHQIRTPLASVMLYISGLNHPLNTKSEKQNFAEKAKERLHHLERMVDDMLIFAKGDISSSEHINLAGFFTQLKNSIDSDYKDQQINIYIDDNIDDISIKANSDALRSAIQNVIDNAINACVEKTYTASPAQDDGTTLIEINVLINNQDQLEITIKDNGCGMDNETKERVLEPFFTTRLQGTGLGLAVVNATITRYGGELKVISEESVGSEFKIKIPVSTADVMLSSNVASFPKSKISTNKSEKQIFETSVGEL